MLHVSSAQLPLSCYTEVSNSFFWHQDSWMSSGVDVFLDGHDALCMVFITKSHRLWNDVRTVQWWCMKTHFFLSSFFESFLGILEFSWGPRLFRAFRFLFTTSWPLPQTHGCPFSATFVSVIPNPLVCTNFTSHVHIYDSWHNTALAVNNVAWYKSLHYA